MPTRLERIDAAASPGFRDQLDRDSWYSSHMFRESGKRYKHPDHNRTWEGLQKGELSELWSGEQLKVLKFGNKSSFDPDKPTILYVPGVDKYNPLDSGEIDRLVPHLNEDCNFLFVVYGNKYNVKNPQRKPIKTDYPIFNVGIVRDFIDFLSDFDRNPPHARIKLDIMAHSYGAASILAPISAGLVEAGLKYRQRMNIDKVISENPFMHLLRERVNSVHLFAPVLSLAHGESKKKLVAMHIARNFPGRFASSVAAIANPFTSLGYPYRGKKDKSYILRDYAERMRQLDSFQLAYDSIYDESKEHPFVTSSGRDIKPDLYTRLPIVGIYLDQDDNVMNYPKVVRTMKDYFGLFFFKKFRGLYKRHYPQDDKFAQDIYNSIIYDHAHTIPIGYGDIYENRGNRVSIIDNQQLLKGRMEKVHERVLKKRAVIFADK